jgi:hypothetical protein
MLLGNGIERKIKTEQTPSSQDAAINVGKGNGHAHPSQSFLDNYENMSVDELLKQGLQIRILGVPEVGAKSRVETQVKLCIQLVTKTGQEVTRWSHLRLPELMVARGSLKRRGSKLESNGPSEDKILRLEAEVVCSSDIPRRAYTCVSCILRERKRALRKKENRHCREELERTGKTDFLDLSDQAMVERERAKIVLFNCNQLVDFTSGGTILPTRITCYCRHHNEKVGFW